MCVFVFVARWGLGWGGGKCVCVCVCVRAMERSVASQIEIDGQDYGEKDDGSEDEDQDAVLDDPAETQT